MNPIGLSHASLAHGPLAALRVAVHVLTPVAWASAAHALRLLGATGLSLPNPARHPREWRLHAYDAVLAEYGGGEDIPGILLGLCGYRPLMLFTAPDAAQDRIEVIRRGADDAVGTDTSAEEIAARVHSLLRRISAAGGVLRCNDLRIDLLARTVRRGDRPISLSHREFDLLAALARSPDDILSRSELRRMVWRSDHDPGTNSIEVHMSRLRRKLDDGHAHAMLRTVKGKGYALVSRMGCGGPVDVPSFAVDRSHACGHPMTG